MTADALSTLFFVAGMKKGRELLANFPGTEIILVDSELQVYVSQGLRDCFQADKGIRTNILNS
ncbi:hypothetical protein D3C81_2145370 [compost metagenome]